MQSKYETEKANETVNNLVNGEKIMQSKYETEKPESSKRH